LGFRQAGESAGDNTTCSPADCRKDKIVAVKIVAFQGDKNLILFDATAVKGDALKRNAAIRAN